ncbi:TolC family protein [Puteibacter caeruleilacunae]|nr:TolC family protein [Puteibacter caeruleilacunae]
MVCCCFSAQSLQAQQVLTLDKALDIARNSSPDIQRSLLSLERAEQSLAAQRASLKSNFSLTLNPVSYSNNRSFNSTFSEWYTNENFETSGTFRVDQPILLTNGTLSLVNKFGWKKSSSDFQQNDSENEAFNNNLYLSLNQPLFTYNSLKLDLKALELDLENTNLSYSMQLLNMEKNVTQFFYNVYLAQMNLNIAKEELANTQKSYDLITNKVEAGLAAKEELYQAELNLATAKSTLQNKEVSLENSKDEFKNYIGMDLFEDIIVFADINLNVVPVDLEQAIQSGLTSRMELRQKEINLENSQFDLIKVKASNEFKGSVDLSVGIIGDNKKLENIYDNPTRNPSVQVSFNVPLWDWGAKKARIRAQEAQIATQELSFEDEKKSIIIDIRKVHRNLRNQLTQIDIAQQNERNAELTYEINLERYKNGDLTGMDLNLYQTQLSDKKIASIQALINYKLELLNMKIQTLYDFEKKESVLPLNNENTKKK